MFNGVTCHRQVFKFSSVQFRTIEGDLIEGETASRVLKAVSASRKWLHHRTSPRECFGRHGHDFDSKRLVQELVPKKAKNHEKQKNCGRQDNLGTKRNNKLRVVTTLKVARCLFFSTVDFQVSSSIENKVLFPLFLFSSFQGSKEFHASETESHYLTARAKKKKGSPGRSETGNNHRSFQPSHCSCIATA